ncbi:MAG: DUF922 domain-containing protein [Planctomycetota bacterium]
MQRQYSVIFLGVVLAFLAGRILAEDVPKEMTVKTKVSPGDVKQKLYWSDLLDQVKKYTLIMDVQPASGRKFVDKSAKPESGGIERWITNPNSETQALFTSTVPPNQKVGEYKPVFNGKFKPTNKNGVGTPIWKVTGVYEVSDHMYEKSGTDPNGNPTGAHKIKSIYEGAKDRPIIDVPVVDANGKIGTMADVEVKLPPGEAGNYVGSKRLLIERENPNITIKKEQSDPTHHDKNMVRYEITQTFSNAEIYSIEMPKWTQLAAAGPVAQAEWNTFYQALLAHEEGHKQIYEDHVKKVQAAVDEYAKTLFFGEACFGPEKTKRAEDKAKELAEKVWNNELGKLFTKLKVLNDAHEVAQKAHDPFTAVINDSVPLK